MNIVLSSHRKLHNKISGTIFSIFSPRVPRICFLEIVHIINYLWNSCDRCFESGVMLIMKTSVCLSMSYELWVGNNGETNGKISEILKIIDIFLWDPV